jgi:hypothetical protein
MDRWFKQYLFHIILTYEKEVKDFCKFLDNSTYNYTSNSWVTLIKSEMSNKSTRNEKNSEYNNCIVRYEILVIENIFGHTVFDLFSWTG